MATATQAAQKAAGKGMVQALARTKERSEVALTLYHNLDSTRVPLLLRQLQNMMPLGVSLVLAPSVPSATAADLAKSEAHIETLIAEKKAMAEKMAAMQAQLDALRGSVPAEGTKWMTLTEARKILHTSYATLWRAHQDGRLTTRIIGGTQRDQLMCDPSTYRRKGRGS